MFEDNKEKQSSPPEQAQQQQSSSSNGSSSGNDQIKRMIVFGGFTAALLVLILAAFLLISWFSGNGEGGEGDGRQEEATTSTTTEEGKLGMNSKLPGEAEEAPTSSDKYLADVEAENLSFGQFYKDPEPIESGGAESYELPLNVKVDVANYHEVSRRLQLDDSIDELNTAGFARLEDQFEEEEADNFYSSYRLLNNKELPVLLTSDFLLYYYNNILKQSFKAVEDNIFYRNLWDINRRLYETAKNEYEQRSEEVGTVNDPLLEARRLEAAFFATSLKLLEPTKEQTSKEAEKLADADKFSPGEASYYSIELPEYLRPDVVREVELIRESSEEEKDSPVLLYERNYRDDFEVPEKYQDTARLNNFYLTSNWLHSVFPLYHKGNECSACLLDKEDWRINMMTALLLSRDLAGNQELQNKWARIYKIISYFNGLREGLTYLDYNGALEDYLGEEDSLSEVFDSYDRADDTLKEIQQDLAEREFSLLGGGYDRSATSTRSKRGLKMLAPPYWPNEFIFERLTIPQVRYYLPAEAEASEEVENTTSCQEGRGSDVLYRCRGTGRDVINLVYPVPEEDEYFAENTAYEFYDDQAEELRARLDRFNEDKWHGSSYWNLLDIADEYIGGKGNAELAFASGPRWENRRIQGSLGAWTDLQTGRDILKIHNPASEESGLGGPEIDSVSQNSYIEPEPELARELLANIRMLHEMFEGLGITRETSSIDDELARVEDELERIRDIIDKELAGEALSEEDIKFIDNFVKQFKVETRGEKEVDIVFENTEQGMTESIDGVDLLVLTYKKGDKNFFAVGPVYNYTEEIDR